MRLRKEGDDRPVILPCYISDTTSRGCSASHVMHPDLEVWLELYSLIGHDTSISQALPLLDRVGATTEDLDVLRAMKDWYRKADEDKRKSEGR